MDMSRMTGASETLRPIRLAFNDFKGWLARYRRREKPHPLRDRQRQTREQLISIRRERHQPV